MACEKMSLKEGDILQYYLSSQPAVTTAKVYERTKDAVICYTGDRADMIQILCRFSWERVSVPDHVWQNSGRAENRKYWDQIVQKTLLHMGCRLFLPSSLRSFRIICMSAKYIRQGVGALLRGKIEVAVLDGAAVAVSLLRRDFKTAGSVMYLLGIGEVLEEWTHKKSVSNLARSMALQISRVWLLEDGKEVLADTDRVKKGDRVVIRMGNVIPFDGVVSAGSGAVNQASMTGEPLPVPKEPGGYVYAGTVLEEGELTVQVKETSGSNKYERIMRMIEESERLKSSVEGNAARLADRLVPYTLLGTALTYLLTGNTTKALAVLMVDFSCALKLAIPISVLSAIREAGAYRITVKGGKFLEKTAEADTILFDKTGTLTKASPVVTEIVPFIQESRENLLRIAACLEEHFPHSMAKAVVRAAQEQGITHDEMHSRVE